MTPVRSQIARLILVSLLVGGCSTGPKSIYQWEGYQKNVDAYFRGKTGPEAQAHSMRKGLRKIEKKKGRVPPGYYAHLGLLYGKQGKLGEFGELMQKEKALFPESSTFVDFLLRNFKKEEA